MALGRAAPRATPLCMSLLPFQEQQPGADGARRQRPKIAAGFFRMVLHMLIRLRWRLSGLKVEVVADSNRKALSGTLRSVFVQFGALRLKRAQITGGGIVEVAGLDMTLRSFLKRLVRGRARYLRRPFEVYVQATMTSEDVARSWWIRNVAQRIVNILMDRAVGSDLTIMTVSVRGASAVGDRLVFSGVIGTAVSTAVPFMVSIRLSVATSGHVLCIDDPEIVLNPGPLQVVVPVVTIQKLQVDLGDDARVEMLRIENSKINIRARALVSPFQRFLVGNITPRAMFQYDLADFVSRFLGMRQLPAPM